MITPLGFNLTKILNKILESRSFNLQELAKSHSGGATFYIEDNNTEQSFIYGFQPNPITLQISITIADTICFCKERVCNCNLDADEHYPDWETYWTTHHEVITLKEAQIKKYLQPSLFKN